MTRLPGCHLAEVMTLAVKLYSLIVIRIVLRRLLRHAISGSTGGRYVEDGTPVVLDGYAITSLLGFYHASKLPKISPRDTGFGARWIS